MNTIASLVTIASFLFGVYTFRRNYLRDIVKDRYEHIVFPLFNRIEPYMYSPDYPRDIASKSIEEISEHRHLAGGPILYSLELCSSTPSSQKHFNALCEKVDREYDKSCKALGIPLRSIRYRLLRKQHPNKFMRALDYIDLWLRRSMFVAFTGLYFALLFIFVYSLLLKMF